MPTTTRRMPGLTIDDHTISVPLVWGAERDDRSIEIHAAVVTRDGGEQKPFLLFLQGGPGFEAPDPFGAPIGPSWLATALNHYRVVLLDQRGTGKSTPVGDGDAVGDPAAVAEYLSHFRADSIAADAEAIRKHLGAEQWSSLGQSFGGFTTLTYLSLFPEALREVFFTGGLSAIGKSPVEVYARTYELMRAANHSYFARFPEQRSALERLIELADAGRLELPTGEVLSVSRLRSLGSLLGSDHGWQTLWSVLNLAPGSNALRYDLAAALPFDGRNPIYYVLHESCYADGYVTDWAADRAEPQDFRDDPTLLTGEHIRRDWANTVPAFKPWQEAAELLAAKQWGRLYDPARISAAEVRGAAAVYFNDRYVPAEFSLETAALMPGVTPLVTSEHEHSGLRTGNMLEPLLALVQESRIR